MSDLGALAHLLRNTTVEILSEPLNGMDFPWIDPGLGARESIAIQTDGAP